MQSPRRFLPSLPLLCAFEAAARLGSITAAARELALTQSAVSRQIIALEAQLEVKLFHRQRQTIKLTVAGEVYAREIGDALRRISLASLNLRANPFGGTLTLAVPPTFATRWLAPRLPGFLAVHPGIVINVLARPTHFDFEREQVDAAIHFGRGEWPAAETMLLRGETVIPACSPQLRERFKFEEPADLHRSMLLHLTSRPDAWERWFLANDVEPQAVHGMLFDQFATVTQAAVAGLGLALLPEFLIEPEIADGSLVAALPLPMRSSESYHLVWPSARAQHPPLEAFRDWILAETAQDR